jgi:hypothetical protein
MARRTALPLLALLILLVSAVPAHAQEAVKPPAPTGHAQSLSPRGPLFQAGAHASARRNALWATVNVCDTFESPDAMGLRASMPGNGTDQRMYMRFSAQWYSGLHEAWLPVPNGRSPWVFVGSARYSARQGGWNFDFVTPSYGRAYILRGSVEYQWRSVRREKGIKKGIKTRVKRAGYRVARERSALTVTGVKNVRGGDPKGTSKAMCAVANVGNGH